MLKFKGNRKLDDIITSMKDKDMEVNMNEFNKGGDYVSFRGGWHSLPLTILFNTFNGQFQVWNGFTGKKLADEHSENLDNEEWYTDLLNTLEEEIYNILTHKFPDASRINVIIEGGKISIIPTYTTEL